MVLIPQRLICEGREACVEKDYGPRLSSLYYLRRKKGGGEHFSAKTLQNFFEEVRVLLMGHTNCPLRKISKCLVLCTRDVTKCHSGLVDLILGFLVVLFSETALSKFGNSCSSKSVLIISISSNCHAPYFADNCDFPGVKPRGHGR